MGVCLSSIRETWGNALIVPVFLIRTMMGEGYFSPEGVIKGDSMYNILLYIKSIFGDYFSSDIM